MREKVMSPKSGGVSRAVDYKHFVYGGAASCIAEGGTFPLDTTKTRLQVQGQQAKHLISGGISPIRSPYKGMIDALFRISREEGITALYRGISPALLRQSIYGTLKFGVYYSLKKVFEEESVASNILCAIIAGMASSAVANPTDVLKVRMQVSSTAGTSSLFASFHKIYLLEGVAGLWRGVGPTSQRAGVIAAVELPVYDGCKKYFVENGILADAMPNHMISSFVASLAAVIASTPVDVIRTRLMSQKLHRGESNPVKPGKTYRGSWDCFVVTFRHEGFRALYKGFIPAWLRMGPWNIIFFTSYEQLLRLY